MERNRVEGKVIGPNSLHANGRIMHCWTIAMQAAVAPQPLDLEAYRGRIVRFERVVHEEGYQEITGKVIGLNIIESSTGPISCYVHGLIEAYFMPLNLLKYMDLTITVAGEPYGSELYRAYFVKVPEITAGRDPAKEAKSLNDLLRIRAASMDKIEVVNENLGTALGFKWTNGQRTNHPCVIIFVEQKVESSLVPDDEKAPEVLEAPNGTWCFTDVVTGGKATPEEIEHLPELSEENKIIVQELRSGEIRLVGGIQLAVYVDTTEGTKRIYGTAGIAVRDKETEKKGFLTNQHVADLPGRRIYHPLHQHFLIGRTSRTKEYALDEKWYDGVINEEDALVRCDYGFIVVDDNLSGLLTPGLHAIGKTRPLHRINPDTMDIIGQKVISVGRTRGVQRGTIVAYAYEYIDYDNVSIYTDLLIIGEEGKAFSAGGDSGKIIVTDDENHSPVALLWGGRHERLRHGHEQEKWTYAIDLGKVLDRLNLELLE
jgi:hypothetical protein